MSNQKNIGIFKILDDSENLITETHTLSPVIQMKEILLKKVLNRTERREIPITFSLCRVFLTNKRLLFLIMKEEYSRELGDDGDLGQTGVIGTWFEFPITALLQYDIRPLELENYSKDNENQVKKLLEGKIKNQSCLEIIYNEKEATGRSKDYAESMMQRGKISKLLGKVESITDKILILGSDASSLAPSLRQFMGESETKETNSENSLFCGKCGTKQYDYTSRFCSKCGAPIQPTIESN